MNKMDGILKKAFDQLQTDRADLAANKNLPALALKYQQGLADLMRAVINQVPLEPTVENVKSVIKRALAAYDKQDNVKDADAESRYVRQVLLGKFKHEVDPAAPDIRRFINEVRASSGQVDSDAVNALMDIVGHLEKKDSSLAVAKVATVVGTVSEEAKVSDTAVPLEAGPSPLPPERAEQIAYKAVAAKAAVAQETKVADTIVPLETGPPPLPPEREEQIAFKAKAAAAAAAARSEEMKVADTTASSLSKGVKREVIAESPSILSQLEGDLKTLTKQLERKDLRPGVRNILEGKRGQIEKKDQRNRGWIRGDIGGRISLYNTGRREDG